MKKTGGGGSEKGAVGGSKSEEEAPGCSCELPLQLARCGLGLILQVSALDYYGNQLLHRHPGC